MTEILIKHDVFFAEVSDREFYWEETPSFNPELMMWLDERLDRALWDWDYQADDLDVIHLHIHDPDVALLAKLTWG